MQRLIALCFAISLALAPIGGVMAQDAPDVAPTDEMVAPDEVAPADVTPVEAAPVEDAQPTEVQQPVQQAQPVRQPSCTKDTFGVGGTQQCWLERGVAVRLNQACSPEGALTMPGSLEPSFVCSGGKWTLPTFRMPQPPRPPRN